MNNELKNMRNPHKLRLIWVILYIIISVVVIYVAVQAADKIKTHTLPTGKVQLTIPYSKYLVGEKIGYTIKNEYTSPIYIINSCPSEPLTVYRQESGKWVRQHYEAKLKDCPDEDRQISVDAGQTVGGSFANWHNLFKRPGKYRVVAVIEHYDSLPYQEFEVVEPSVASIDQTIVTNTELPVINSPTETTTPTKTDAKPAITNSDRDENEPEDD